MTITLIWNIKDKTLLGVVPSEHVDQVVSDILCTTGTVVGCQDIELGDYHDEGIYNAGELYDMTRKAEFADEAVTMLQGGRANINDLTYLAQNKGLM